MWGVCSCLLTADIITQLVLAQPQTQQTQRFVGLDSTLVCCWHWSFVHRLFKGSQKTWNRFSQSGVFLISQLIHLYVFFQSGSRLLSWRPFSGLIFHHWGIEKKNKESGSVNQLFLVFIFFNKTKDFSLKGIAKNKQTIREVFFFLFFKNSQGERGFKLTSSVDEFCCCFWAIKSTVNIVWSNH